MSSRVQNQLPRKQPLACASKAIKALLTNPNHREISLIPRDGAKHDWIKPFKGTNGKQLLCTPPGFTGKRRTGDIGKCHLNCEPAAVFEIASTDIEPSLRLQLARLCPNASAKHRDTYGWATTTDARGEEVWQRCLSCALDSIAGCPLIGRPINDVTTVNPALDHQVLHSMPADFAAASVQSEAAQKQLKKAKARRAELDLEHALAVKKVDEKVQGYTDKLALLEVMWPHCGERVVTTWKAPTKKEKKERAVRKAEDEERQKVHDDIEGDIAVEDEARRRSAATRKPKAEGEMTEDGMMGDILEKIEEKDEAPPSDSGSDQAVVKDSRYPQRGKAAATKHSEDEESDADEEDEEAEEDEEDDQEKKDQEAEEKEEKDEQEQEGVEVAQSSVSKKVQVDRQHARKRASPSKDSDDDTPVVRMTRSGQRPVLPTANARAKQPRAGGGAAGRKR